MTNTQAPQESTSAVPSDRLWLRSELMGTQVITRDTGRRLGLVGEVVVDIDRREVVALGLRDNPLTRFLPGLPRWLPLDQIRQVGDVILVDTLDSLSENFVPERFNKVINCQVITESGDQLGRVLGFSFDIETGELLTLVMGALGVPLLGEGVLSTWEMPVDEIVSSGPDRIIVYEGAEEKLKQLSSGFLEKLGVGNSGWEESERDRYRVNLVPVENQLSSGESSNEEQLLLEQAQEEIFQEDEMEYVELQESEEQQYNQELRYLDEPDESSIYSEIEESQSNYDKSKLINRSDNYEPRISTRNSKNRSQISRDEEPLDIEPLEKPPIEKIEDSTFKDKELLDIEDPW
ncbi:PRC-barrel domain-containing protein [Prochlorococcus marinus]|uniref:Photosystem reaction center subunit H n=1 Tax=Prochlorococcus marinus XMU1408 TaxID=2213228 RepID=A0A318RCJ1_PROMR|nr:PRC-barrel domain-containing protein [Prochlorococcus marinus]MBW3041116.1 photosystem reaction center subunit H [Prochlorococcus marinus str. XMU1408]PYE03718.1 photosystem reaction center subunit H [Prochlorococcus marinus XMU1408]